MLHFLRRSTLFFMLLVLGVAWGGCAKRITSVQPVNIPDANLRTAIEDALHKPAGAKITNADMATLTSLEPGWGDIRELTGLEFATNLTYVASCPQPDIESIAPRRINKTAIPIYRRKQDNRPIASCEINKSEGTESPRKRNIRPLTPCRIKNLRFLGISDCKVSDLSPLTELTNLEHLNIQGSQLSDLSPLAGLTNLAFLSINDSRVSDLTPLAGLTNLRHLGLYGNKISDLSALAGLTNLEMLGLDINRVSDLSPLVRLTNLSEINVRSNPLNPKTIAVDVPVLEAAGADVNHSYQ